MINFFKSLWEDFIISRYVSVGLQWGDAESYSFMGECVGYNSLCKSLERLETQYAKLGYKVVDRETWVLAGGYGEEYESKLRIKVYKPKIVIRDSGASEWVNSAEYFLSEEGQEFLKKSSEFAKRYIEKND
jgi:hypothetical protein